MNATLCSTLCFHISFDAAHQRFGWLCLFGQSGYSDPHHCHQQMILKNASTKSSIAESKVKLLAAY